ncbi:MAG: alanyl-tRNA editing protein [bacterium]
MSVSNFRKRLYYDDSYLTRFEANVVEQYRKGDRFAVILDRTAFYPTSGGQMHDLGFLNERPVLEVLEDGGEVLHLVELPFDDERLSGKIDWQRRFSFMQQHTAFHILAQAFLRALRLDTLSSHLGESASTIDIAADDITWEQIEQVEKLVHQVVFENRPVETFWVEKGKLQSLSLRKMPPDIQKPIRLVSIKDFDLDPCGGTHVRNTGEVGIVKILSWEKVRGNIRCTFQAGWRGLKDYQQRVVTTQAIAQAISVTDDEMVKQVIALKASLKQREKQLQKKNEKLLQLEAQQFIENLRRRPEKTWTAAAEQKTPAEIKFLAKTVGREAPAGVIIYSNEEPMFLVVVWNGDNEKDLRLLIPKLQKLMDVKGGGSPNFVELHGLNRNNSQQAIGEIKIFLEQS